MSIYNLGRVVPIFKGDYNNETEYKYLDVVLYNGSSYVVVKDSTTGNLPNNTEYWAMVAQAGTLSPEQIADIEQQIIDYVQSQGYVIDSNYVHTDNNFTTADKTKLNDIDMTTKQDTLVSGSNIKTVNNESLLGSGNVSINVPTKTSDLTNDSSFATTSDVSSAVSGKQDTLISGTNIKTINNESLLGSGNITISGGGSGTDNYNALNNLPQINGITLTGNKSSSDLGINIPSVINDLTTGGTTNALSAEMGKELGENKINKIDKGTEEIWTEVDAIEGYPKSSTYLNNNAVEGTIDSNSFAVLKCAVNAGDTYYITGATGTGTGSTLAAFYNSEDSLISGSKIDSGVANARKTRYEVIAPSNAAHIRIQGFTNIAPKCETKEIVEIIVSNNQAKLNSIGLVEDLETTEKTTLVGAVNEVNSTINAISEVYVSKNLFDKNEIIDGTILSTSGDFTNIPSWAYNKCTKPIPIEPNKYYCISGGTINGGGNIRCLASDGTTKMKVLNPSTGSEGSNYIMPGTSGTSINGQFLTPPTAAYIQFNIAANTRDSTNTIMLELVGDTYNPNFVPSEYEDYGTTIQIKESALPKNEESYESYESPKVLLIGSSHGMNTISQLPWMFYYQGYKNIKVGNVYIGSFMIQELAQRIVANQTLSYQEFNDIDVPAWGKNNTPKLMSQLLDMGWDVISLQRSASDDETWTTSQATSFEFVIKYISNYCKTNKLKAPRIIMNTGFADRNTAFTHTENIMNTAKQVKQELGIEYYPTAMALANARNTWMKDLGKVGFKYLCYDSQHLDYGIGCWVASACLYEAIMRPLGESVATINGYGTQEQQAIFISTAGIEGNYTEPTQKTMEIAKSCVLAAFNDDTNLNTVLASKYQYENQVEVFANWITLGGTDAGSKCVATGGNYNITFSVWSGASLSSVSVEMNGADITSTAYDSTNSSINISNVDGDIRVIIKTTR